MSPKEAALGLPDEPGKVQDSRGWPDGKEVGGLEKSGLYNRVCEQRVPIGW